MQDRQIQASQIGYNPTYSEEHPSVEQVESLNGEVLIEFGAPWCPHCQAATPAVQEVLAETSFQDIPHIKIFDGKGKRLGRAFKVKRWPTLILLHDGKEVARIVRPLKASDVRELLQKSS